MCIFSCFTLKIALCSRVNSGAASKWLKGEGGTYSFKRCPESTMHSGSMMKNIRGLVAKAFSDCILVGAPRF